MKICIAHNRYQQHGGEDRVVDAEAAMLAREGHEVELLDFDNDEIQGAPRKMAAAASAFFSMSAYGRVKSVLSAFRPDVLHVHNFMPTLSPAVFFAASSSNTPVVQTLHNYRMQCANAELFREGKVCERCIDARSFVPGVVHGCYRDSRMGSAVVGGTMALHAAAGTWQQRITRYIALTNFAAEKLGGFRIPRERIRVKPNFVPDRGEAEGGGGYALFAGRLSSEKGVTTLIEADRLGRLAMPVYIAGHGPLQQEIVAACARPGSKLTYLGLQSSEQTMRWMRRAEVLLVPSLWYEGFPMVVVEALSGGVPVIASRIGSLQEIVQDGETGMLHDAGSAPALAECLQRFSACAKEQKTALRAAARKRYLLLYSEARNLRMLLDIYGEAVEELGTQRNKHQETRRTPEGRKNLPGEEATVPLPTVVRMGGR